MVRGAWCVVVVVVVVLVLVMVLVLVLVLILLLVLVLLFFFSPSIDHPGEVIVDHITNLLGREEPGRRRIGDGLIWPHRDGVVVGDVVRGLRVGPRRLQGQGDGVVVRGRGLRVVRGRGLVVRSVAGFFVLVVRGRGLCVVVVFALRGVVFAAQQRPQHTNAFIADCFIHGTWDWC